MIRNPNSQATTNHLRDLFQYLGVPEVIVTDNGSQFTSQTFQEFCEDLGIKHPQLNWQADRLVDTFKRAINKVNNGTPTMEGIQVYLNAYRMTPIPNSPEGKSPADSLPVGKENKDYIFQDDTH